jgi:hypothetical protein
MLIRRFILFLSLRHDLVSVCFDLFLFFRNPSLPVALLLTKHKLYKPKNQKIANYCFLFDVMSIRRDSRMNLQSAGESGDDPMRSWPENSFKKAAYFA